MSRAIIYVKHENQWEKLVFHNESTTVNMFHDDFYFLGKPRILFNKDTGRLLRWKGINF